MQYKLSRGKFGWSQAHTIVYYGQIILLCHLVPLGLHPAQPEMAQPQGETLSEMCTHMITMLSCSTPLQVRETMV